MHYTEVNTHAPNKQLCLVRRYKMSLDVFLVSSSLNSVLIINYYPPPAKEKKKKVENSFLKLGILRTAVTFLIYSDPFSAEFFFSETQ